MIHLLAILLAVLLPQEEEKPYPVERKWEGNGGQVAERGVTLLCSRAAFADLWKRNTGKQDGVPEIDFKKHFVVAVFPEGKWHGISSSVTADKDRVTVTLVLGNKKAIEYVPQHALLVLPRTALPIRVRTRENSCTGIDAANDKVVGELVTTCRQPGECIDCRKGGGRRACPECGKGECSGLELMCRACGKLGGVCSVCGKVPSEPCAKPGACHSKHLDEAGACTRCKAAIGNGCDALCAKCAGERLCRLCGKRIAGK